MSHEHAGNSEPGTIEISDYTLALRTGKGDVQAFQELYLRHRRSVYSLCLRMTANVADSEDLAQEVFIKVLRYVRGFRGESAFKTWLRRLTVNHVLMHFRRRRLRPESSIEDDQIPVQVVRQSWIVLRLKEPLRNCLQATARFSFCSMSEGMTIKRLP